MLQIYRELARYSITPERRELESLVRGASVMFDGKKFAYPSIDEWAVFSG